jgi:hypothetical protein
MENHVAVSKISKDLGFMQLHGNSGEAVRRVVCDNTHRLRMETRETPVEGSCSPAPDDFVTSC